MLTRIVKGIGIPLVGFALLLPGSQAVAGGATWQLNGQPSTFAAFAPGQRIEATSSIWLPSVRDQGSSGDFHGGPQHGPYFGWVFERPRPRADFPPPLPADSISVGEVVFHDTGDTKVMDLSLSFELPDLEPGEYGLVTCNEGCERQIGDIWMTGFTVVEDAGQVMLAGRVERLEHRLRITRFQLSDKTGEIRQLRAELETRAGTLEQRLDDLSARPAADREPVRSSLPTWPVVATAVFIGLAIFMVARPQGRRDPSLEL